jgi:hypothetical protein
LNSTHDCFLLDGRIARFSLTCGIAGHFAKEAIGVVPLTTPAKVSTLWRQSRSQMAMSYLNEPSGLPRRIISWQ